MHATRIGRDNPTASPPEDGAVAGPRAGLERSLQASRRAYIEALHIAAAIVALDGDEPRVVVSNRAFVRLIAEVGGVGPLPTIMAQASLFLLGQEAERDVPVHEPAIGGRHLDVHFSRLPAVAPHGARAMVSVIDRTAEVETERSLRAEMLHDSLTGLPNRMAFIEAVDAAIARDGGAENFAVLAVDLTRFSRVNECVGALAGDELIITVACRLMAALDRGAVLARMAGDEFGVLLPLTEGPGDALHAARRLQGALHAPVRLSDLEIRIDCAIGCALWSELSPTSVEILRNAQVALKRAKVSGRLEMYQPGEVGRSRRRFSLETQLRHAIEGDRLEVAFQPLVRLDKGRVAGFEALARWHDPDLGTVSPAEFIAVAEDSGLIVQLGRWVLDRSLRTLVEWDAAAGRTLPLYLCVNVSPVQLVRDSVADMVRDTLAARGIGGDRLTLELTESSIVADPERAKRVLEALKSHDCRVAMDDFGTGYSSLSSLQKLPIDMLKIDRSFVAAMLDDRDSIAIVRAILGLADALGMQTTAEGVETAETARMLGALGCTVGQGYHFARPLDPAAAMEHFRRGGVGGR